MNMSLQMLGLIPVVYGIWAHVPELILLGISLVFAGHTFGWSEVDGRFTYWD
jgi:xanthine/uracil permease